MLSYLFPPRDGPLRQTHGLPALCNSLTFSGGFCERIHLIRKIWQVIVILFVLLLTA